MEIDKAIWRRYLTNQCSEEEMKLVESWFDYYQLNSVQDEELIEKIVASLDDKILTQAVDTKARKLSPWYYAAAASIILMLGFLGINVFYKGNQNNLDIPAPNGNNAVVVLENQKELSLSDIKNGDTINLTNYSIVRNQLGELIYIQSEKQTAPVYNTIRTKAGGIANVVLADGTKVWINSKSEISYPIAFSETLREVTLTGEAYFQVEKDANRPFFVRSNTQTIKVLGTRFNVREKQGQTFSTLLEGKIALNKQKSPMGVMPNEPFSVILMPYETYDGFDITKNSNAKRAIDWTEGIFDFSELTLEEATSKMSDWYDVNFEIQKGLEHRKLFGKLTKTKSLKQVLNVLAEVLKIKYTIKGKNVIIHT